MEIAIALIALAVSIWTYYDTRILTRREHAMILYKEISTLIDSALRIGDDLYASFESKEPANARTYLWNELNTLRTFLRNNRSRLQYEMALYYGHDLADRTLRLADSFTMARDTHFATIVKEAESCMFFEHSIVESMETWTGALYQNFSEKDSAIRWKLLRTIGGRDARRLEAAERKRLQELT